ncbi:hypothetical protein DY000_02050209 [Brassica cretica]|uniref:Uncharacterized protein n=1 Tax=Brassica cretica TaxID=69181 RepID=A0ABQ7F4C2_BRACR|nr:hypothetical protein DY000_02050209 [Brassica cretica]
MNENDAAVDGDEGRPLGVKAAKRSGKKAVVEGKEREDFDHMWELKKEDLILKQSLSKMNLLSQLVARQGDLDDAEEVLKKKLIEASVGSGRSLQYWELTVSTYCNLVSRTGVCRHGVMYACGV